MSDDDVVVGQSHSPHGCEHVGPRDPATEYSAKCGRPAETVDMVHGFRCAEHPPTYSETYAEKCRAFQPGVASAYRRTMIALLVAQRDALNKREAS